RARRVGTLRLEMPPLQEGPGWQDFRARHERFPDDPPRRVRIYLVGKATTPEQRGRLVRAAEREYRALRGIEFPGIAAPVDFVEHDLSPALVFPYDVGFARLDHFLAEHGRTLRVDERLDLLRAIAETIAYAHWRVLTHRGLNPRCVWVRRDGDGFAVRVSDWQTASRGPGTGTRVTATRTVADLTDVGASAFCAPEWAWSGENGVALDVFALGYLLVTGSPPASSYGALAQRLHTQGALHVAQQVDGVPEQLDRLVAAATAADAARRTPDVTAFLADLDKVRVQLAAPEERELPPTDPLDAEPEDTLEGGFVLLRRLGRGSTALALLVHRGDPDDPSVLKVSLDPDRDARLRAEAAALAVLGDSPGIARLEDGPLSVAGRQAILVSYAGERTLGQELRERGRLQPEWLHDWGLDLLDVLDVLERAGVAHRDIKPDNLGVHQRGGKNTKRRLALFDFSLAGEPLDAVEAGTVPYRDPFLGTRERPVWDTAAERYAAAVTLYEMASGRRPEYGTAAAHPGFSDVDVTIDAELFDRSYATGLADFFRRALARSAHQRFDTAEDMRRAWDAVFASPETVVPPDTAVRRITRDTPIGAAGLSPQVLTVLERLGVATVGDAADLSPAKVAWLPGIGSRTRALLSPELDRLRAQLPAAPEPALAPTLLDRVAASLLPGDHARPLAEQLLRLGEHPPPSWPSLREVARALRREQRDVRDEVAALEAHWVGLPGMTELRDVLVEVLDGLGGVAPAALGASALLDRLASAVEEPLRDRLVDAVVRAAVEAELADPELDGNPRLTYSRQRHGILLAAGAAGSGPSTAQRLEWASRLGAAADALAGTAPLPVPQRVVETLRAVPPADPGDLGTASDELLVAVAVLAAQTAAATPRLEVYPRGLDAGRALRLAAGSLYGASDLTAEQVAERVAARFRHAEPLPARPGLDALLERAGVPLVWDEASDRYVTRQAAVAGVSALDSSTRRGSGRTATGSRSRPGWRRVEDAVLAADDRLLGSLESGGWLVVTTAPRRLQRAERCLAAYDGVCRVDVEAVVLDGMRTFARGRRVRWDTVLAADAADRRSPDWARLQQVVAAGVEALRESLGGAGSAVLLANAGILARYDAALGVLAEVKDWLRTAGLRGLRTAWLLVPWADAAATPLLDGVAVPMLGTEWLPLPTAWIERHEKVQGDAA
ncbi:MAG TPA: BREX system serine/threonine kinase PglW, partial [Mycobacteriales bacterium]|nr:BREX system serine/threonine kinase PglW [Mycobacteriales bacterium]